MAERPSTPSPRSPAPTTWLSARGLTRPPPPFTSTDRRRVRPPMRSTSQQIWEPPGSKSAIRRVYSLAKSTPWRATCELKISSMWGTADGEYSTDMAQLPESYARAQDKCAGDEADVRPPDGVLCWFSVDLLDNKGDGIFGRWSRPVVRHSPAHDLVRLHSLRGYSKNPMPVWVSC